MRWSALPVLSLLSVLVLAGCMSGIPSPSPEEQSNRQLGSVEIRNDDTEPHTVDVLIEKDNEIVYWTTRQVAGPHNNTSDGAILVPDRFVEEPGRYVISARLDNSSTGERFSLSSESDSGCYTVMVRIEEDATITFLTSKGAYECEQTTTVATS